MYVQFIRVSISFYHEKVELDPLISMENNQKKDDKISY